MGVGMLEPGEFVAEHYHPDSEEFLFLVRGRVEVTLGGAARTVELGVSTVPCPRVRASGRVNLPFRHRARPAGR